MLKLLQAWRDWGRETNIHVDIVTQFCFESAPILKLLGELVARGIDLPVIVGLAGPATPATLTKFALRCGIGNSMRALRGQIGRYGRLLTDTGPDDVLRGLQAAPRPRPHRSPDSTCSRSADYVKPVDGWTHSSATNLRRAPLHIATARRREKRVRTLDLLSQLAWR